MSAFKKSLLVAGVAMIPITYLLTKVTALLNLKVKLSLLHVQLNQVTKT